MFVDEIRYHLNYDLGFSREKPKFILCIVPTNDKTTYSLIKRTCCIEFCVPSQIISERVLSIISFRILIIVTP